MACVLSAMVSVPALPATRDHVTGRFELNVTVPPFCDLVADGLMVNPPLVIRFWPVPDSEMICGEPAAESTIETAATSGPTTEGVNEIEIVHVAPDATVAGQVFDAAKSAAFVPVTLMLVTVKNEVPESVSVTTCGVLLVVMLCAGNVIDGLLSDTCGFAPLPPPTS